MQNVSHLAYNKHDKFAHSWKQSPKKGSFTLQNSSHQDGEALSGAMQFTISYTEASTRVIQSTHPRKHSLDNAVIQRFTQGNLQNSRTVKTARFRGANVSLQSSIAVLAATKTEDHKFNPYRVG